jgi:hypothetical protein
MIKYKSVNIYKYMLIDGIATIPDSFFVNLFNKIIDEGAEHTFWMLSKREDLNPFKFMNWCKMNHFYFVEYGDRPGGFTVVTELRSGFGMIDIYLFKEHWGTDRTDEIRMDTTEWLLLNEWLSLICFIPRTNELMEKALHKVKWKDLGVIKNNRINKKTGEFVDSWVGYGNREMYR